MPTIENKTWSVLTHASTFSKYFFPFGNLLIPLSILVIKKRVISYIAANILYLG
ncbi:MAG: DUF4870 domain-containing protein [Mesonia sp.]